MLYIDAKYASRIYPYVRNFKHKNDYLWNFSCPICGDSKKNPSRARGYIYRKKNDLFVKCHKCGYGKSLGDFLRRISPTLYDEYALERYAAGPKSNQSHKEPEDKFAIFKTENALSTELLEDDILNPLDRLDQLPESHPGVVYVKQRMIPKKYWNLLYFTKKFKAYTNWLIPNKFSPESLLNDHPRMIIPYFTPSGKVYMYTARAYGTEEPKYFSIKLDNNYDKVYGLDRVDYSKPIYVVEGPIDSLFLPNAIAVSGSSFDGETLQRIKTNCVVIFDNEPRSKEITKLIHKTIKLGYRVCLFPDYIEEKDINSVIMSGITQEELLDIINKNTFQGIEAELVFSKWRKI